MEKNRERTRERQASTAKHGRCREVAVVGTEVAVSGGSTVHS